MGYSTPKKQLDLKEFLSQPAKKLPIKRFGLRKAPTKPMPNAGSIAPNRNKSET